MNGVCDKTSNNKFFNCPPRMSDGRHFTDYRPSIYVNDLVRYSNNVMSNFVNNQDNNLLWCNESDGLYKWTESAIATSSFSVYSYKPLEILRKHNLITKVNPLNRKHTPEELVYYGGDALGIIAGTESYSKSMIEQLKELKIISRLGKGMDNIDITSAREKGVKVLQTKTSPAPAVSELVLGLILNVARKIYQSNKALKEGQWKKQMGSLVQGKTLGIIGLGSIGKNLVKLVKWFNFHILARQDETFAAENGVVYCDLDKLFFESDIVSIHMNLTNESNRLISRKLLKK